MIDAFKGVQGLKQVSHVAVYFATLIAFVALDLGWLTLVAGDMFQREVGELLRPKPHIAAIVIFYIIYPAGLVMLAVQPALVSRSAVEAAWRGAVFGIGAYGTYNLTNYATLDGWPLALSVKDFAWGTFASEAACIAGYAVGTRFKRCSWRQPGRHGSPSTRRAA